MKLAALWTLAAIVFILLTIWLRCQVHYRIGSKHVKVTLFGMTIRRVALTNIARISKKRHSFSENWSNTLRPSHRTLTIIKQSGLRKHFVITPKNRYVFLADLQNAIKRVTAQDTPLPVEAED